MSNILLERVTLTGGLTLPGVLLLNASTPGENFTFVDVTNTGVFLVEKDYVCQNIHGVSDNSSPMPPCFVNSTAGEMDGGSGGSVGVDADGDDEEAQVRATALRRKVGAMRLAMLEAAIAALPENQ